MSMKLKWEQSEVFGYEKHYGYTESGVELVVLLDPDYVDDTGDGMQRWRWRALSGQIHATPTKPTPCVCVSGRGGRKVQSE